MRWGSVDNKLRFAGQDKLLALGRTRACLVRLAEMLWRLHEQIDDVPRMVALYDLRSVSLHLRAPVSWQLNVVRAARKQDAAGWAELAEEMRGGGVEMDDNK